MAEHYSVMLKEAIDLLSIKPNGIYLDLTLGRAGHSSEILKRLTNGKLYCFDIDQEAIEKGTKKLSQISGNFKIIKSNFGFAKEELSKLGVEKVDGILMDLGVSSPQFDEAERGFSYRFDGPLDMRMDLDNDLTAEKIVNTYDYEELKRVFLEYGEDPDSAKIAKMICLEREKRPIKTTFELNEIIKKAKPMKSLSKKGHPSKQIFQALRIEVNDELGMLKKALSELPSILNNNGRMVIITFHSLEDRMVKKAFRSLTVVEGSRHAPILEDKEAGFIDLTRHPILPSEIELEENHRSSSAKLRAIEKKG